MSGWFLVFTYIFIASITVLFWIAIKVTVCFFIHKEWFSRQDLDFVISEILPVFITGIFMCYLITN